MRVKCATSFKKKIECLLIVLSISLCSIHSLADDIDPQLSIIAKSLQRQSELSNEIQLIGTLIWKRAWPQRSGKEWKESAKLSTRKWDIFLARSGDKIRFDSIENFPDKILASITNKYIVESGQLINAFGFEVANPHVVIEEAQWHVISIELPMLLNSHYSLLIEPLSEELLKGENYTFQIIGEEACNESSCIVLHGEMNKACLVNAKPPLSQDTKIFVDLWLDTQKDFSVIQYKYHIENLHHIEKSIELGKVESEGYGTIWFPKKVTKKEYNFIGGEKQLVSEISFLVQEVTIMERVDSSLFTLDGLGLLPGTKVIDKIEGVSYKWGEDVIPSKVEQQRIEKQGLKEAQEQRQLKEQIQRRLEGQQEPPTRFNRILILTILVALIIVGLGLAIIWRNKKRLE